MPVDNNDDPVIAQNDMGTGADAPNSFSGAVVPAVLSGTGYMSWWDRDDYYRVSLAVGDSLRVTMTPPTGVDFDLALLDPSGTVLESSNAPTITLSAIAAVIGDYRIHARRISGRGRYALSISHAPAVGSPDASVSVADAGSAGGAPIGLVQLAVATPSQPSASVTATFPGAQQSGDLNVVVVGWNDTSNAITSVADSANNIYLSAGPSVLGANLTQAIYYAPNIQASSSNNVTVTFSGNAALVDIRVLEYSGLTTARVDRTSAASGSTSLASCGAITTSGMNELIVAAGTTGGAFSAAGPGFTSEMITQPDGDLVEEQIAHTAGTYSVSAYQSADAPWVMQAVAFTGQDAGTTPDAGPSPDATAPADTGVTPDSGTAADAGAIDAGSPTLHSVSLTWVASASQNVAGYRVYRSATRGGPYALLNPSLISGTSYTDTNVENGATYFYVTTALDAAGDESTSSNESTAVIPL
jgi:hypothetical protein